MKKDNRAFTLKELVLLIVILGQLTVLGLFVYVVAHFIRKFW